ncbi:hypothetical protein CRG98_022776 [Punica granatum]|uniref:Uncharacterized protein n=1 Tax=Punica granatum TaxID=22663 RepID=A0A2I0JKM6_PUNGR|nr:hypothetical protein CRG98_022776 [Punica granatum]
MVRFKPLERGNVWARAPARCRERCEAQTAGLVIGSLVVVLANRVVSSLVIVLTGLEVGSLVVVLAGGHDDGPM